MPVGKVKFYDADKGFGFVTNPGFDDVHVAKNTLPDGVKELHPGQRIEYDFATDSRGRSSVLRVTFVEPPRQPRKPQHKYEPAQLNGMIADVITLLETKVQGGLAKGRYPDRKTAKPIAEILRAIAKELDQ